MMSKKKKTRKENNNKRVDDIVRLPEEFVIEDILTRLPVRTLSQWSCVSKLWYNIIVNDKQFAKTHFANSKIRLFVDVLNVWSHNEKKACLLSLDDDCDKYRLRLYTNVILSGTCEPVGYCNGLGCITLVQKGDPGIMLVHNRATGETLCLPYLLPNNGECKYLCHGLGFDSLSEEYKIVIILASTDNKEFITMVFTLGTKSWRSIVTSVADISPPPGCSPFPSRMVTKAWGNIRTPATFCGGHLFWRITNTQVEVEEDEIIVNNKQYQIQYNDKIGMLLSFDIRKEKIRFIRLPAVVANPKATLIEHQLLEHKGYPCVALSEKATGDVRPRCNAKTSLCYCLFMVQLYILKDQEKQVWIKVDSFVFQVKELGLLPGLFCCYLDTTNATTASYPTQILSVSGQVLLYSFEAECLKLYNFQKKHLEVVRSSSCDFPSRRLFEVKMKGFPPGNDTADDEYCPYLDYQLHAQVENIHSLKNFIPAGETRTFDQYNDYRTILRSEDNPLAAGWVITQRKSVQVHAFF